MIYITGDLHGANSISKFNNENFIEQKELSKSDFLIITGDFGLVWDNSKQQKYWRNWLNEKSYTTLFIDGNHENFDILNKYPIQEWNGGKVHFIEDSIIHLMRGQVFEIDNKKIFTMGGAESIDKYRRIEHISWWKEEIPSKLEYDEGLDNLSRYNNNVDYIITHTCAESMYDKLTKYMLFPKQITNINNYFDILENNVKFKQWYFGHFHGDEQLDEKHTLLYNTIIKI